MLRSQDCLCLGAAPAQALLTVVRGGFDQVLVGALALEVHAAHIGASGRDRAAPLAEDGDRVDRLARSAL